MRTEFQGVTLDRFCETDRERIAGMPDEAVGIAGLCRRCTRVLDQAALERGEFVGWNRNPSRAVIASDGKGHGAVVWWVGIALWSEIAEAGLTDLGDLGLDDAPAGISIWEGKLRAYQTGNPLDGYDQDTCLDGRFRDLTDEEWEAIQDARPPWDERDWWAKSLPSEDG